jgi:hypothetical protein
VKHQNPLYVNFGAIRVEFAAGPGYNFTVGPGFTDRGLTPGEFRRYSSGSSGRLFPQRHALWSISQFIIYGNLEKDATAVLFGS